MMNQPSTFYVENLGCAKNQVDAEVMVAALEKQGWSRREDAADAELIIINTCSFIQPAREESVTTFMDFRQAYPGKQIVIAGCFSQRYGTDLESMIPEADGIFGNADPARIVELAASLDSSGTPKILIPADGGNQELERKPAFSMKGSAYVKIAEGCDNRCSYCAIPLIRGPLRSRTINSVVNEVKTLLDSGVFEVNLIAQDLTSFGMDRGREEFLDLLQALCKLPGRFWVRMLYIYPDRFPEGLLDLCVRDPRILPYFDLPFQHAAAKVLKRMGRRGNSSRYIDLVQRIRERLPHACIRSTFLVGHPGEGTTEFKELLRFQAQVQLDWSGFFTYSPEEGTASKAMRTSAAELVASRVALKRKSILEKRQVPITEKRLSTRIGVKTDVLIEERIQGEALCIGRTYFTAPEVDGSVVVHSDSAAEGDVIHCRIFGRNGKDMEAVPNAQS